MKALRQDGTTYEFEAPEQSPVMSGCPCSGCSALRSVLAGDEKLVRLYGRKLLIRGWAGSLARAERAYVKAHATWARRTAGANMLQAVAEARRLRHEQAPELQYVLGVVLVRQTAPKALQKPRRDGVRRWIA